MQTKIKRGISVLMSFALMAIMLLPVTVNAKEIASGICGENLNWTLDDEGTLTISGDGDMTYGANVWNVPWYGEMTQIKNVIIDRGVSSVGDYAFWYCNN